MLSPFLVSPPKTRSPYSLLTPPAHQPTHSYFLALAFPYAGALSLHRPRAPPPVDDQLGHLLLHMQLEQWVPPCALFGWWFSPWELWEYWLVHIVVSSLGLQTPLASWVLPLAYTLGTLCSVQWMDASIHFCICQALAVSLRRQLYQAPFSKHFFDIHNSVWVWWL